MPLPSDELALEVCRNAAVLQLWVYQALGELLPAHRAGRGKASERRGFDSRRALGDPIADGARRTPFDDGA